MESTYRHHSSIFTGILSHPLVTRLFHNPLAQSKAFGLCRSLRGTEWHTCGQVIWGHSEQTFIAVPLDCYTVLTWWHYDCPWGMWHDLQLPKNMLGLPQSQWIVGSRDRFFIGHWQSPFHSPEGPWVRYLPSVRAVQVYSTLCGDLVSRETDQECNMKNIRIQPEINMIAYDLFSLPSNGTQRECVIVICI